MRHWTSEYQQLFQRYGFHRLRQVVVEPGLERPPFVLFLSPASQGNEGHAATPRLLPDVLRSLVAIYLGQANVQQHHLGPKGRRYLYRLQAIVSGIGFVAHHSQHHHHAVSSILVVIHHKDATLRARTELFASDQLLWRWHRTIHHWQMNDELAA